MRYFLLFVTTFIVHTAISQSNLDYYIESAIKSSPLIQENTNLEAINELEKQRLVKELSSPKVSVTADYLIAPYFNNRKLIDATPEQQAIGYDAGITNGGLYSGLINISQPLFNKRTVKPYTESLSIEQQRYSFNNGLAKQSLKQLITDQYIKVYYDQQLVYVNNQLLGILADQVTIVNKLVSSGLLKQSDGLLINLELKNQHAIIASLKNQNRQDLLDLYTMSGISDTLSVALDEPNLVLDAVASNKNKFTRQFEVDSLAVLAAANIFETKYRPTINVFGNAGLNAVQITDIQRKFGISAGVGLSIPIYDGHQKQLNRQKTALSLNSIHQYRELKEIEIENNRIKYNEAIKSLENNITALTSQKNGYDLLFRQFKAEIQTGQLSIIDYINSMKIYRQVQINLVNMRKELMMMKNGYNYWNW